MNELRNSAERIARMSRFPATPPDRKLECEKAAARLAGYATGVMDDKEPWEDFLRRIGVI